MMQGIKHYTFFKTKYGDELLIDVVSLKDIKKYLSDSPTHTLSYYDISFITEADNGRFAIDSDEYIVQPGDVVFSRPNQVRTWDTEKISDGYALIFEEEFLLTFFNDQDFLKNIAFFDPFDDYDNKLYLNKKDRVRYTNLLTEIKNEIELYKEKDKHILRALLYQAVKFLDRIYTSQRRMRRRELPNKKRHAAKFIEMVNNEFMKEHYIHYYAGKLCITPNHLNELVREATGNNAKQVIQNKLLGEAKRMLLYTSATIAKISSDLGYENSSYFIRTFKKQTGYTPMVFRNMNKP